MTTLMEDLLRQSKDRAETIRMTADEKAAIRSRLSAYMTMTPAKKVRNDAPARHGMAERPILNLFSKPMSFIALFLSMMLAGGGVSYAAEGAVPGDVLYPVKVRINEEVRAALAVNAKTRAEWEATRATRRLDEANTLSTEHKATPEMLAHLEGRFAAHESRVEAHIAEVEEKFGPEAAARITSRLETSLAAHKAILERISARVDVDVDAENRRDKDDDDADDSDEVTSAQADVTVDADDDAGTEVEADASVDVLLGDGDDEGRDEDRGNIFRGLLRLR